MELDFLEDFGWELMCESPLEIALKDDPESRASGAAAEVVIDYLRVIHNKTIPDYCDACPECSVDYELRLEGVLRQMADMQKHQSELRKQQAALLKRFTGMTKKPELDDEERSLAQEILKEEEKMKYPYEPDYAVPPGETLQEVLDSSNLTQNDLAKRIIQDKQPITHEMSSQLESITNVPAQFWNNLELQYRKQLAKGKPIYMKNKVWTSLDEQNIKEATQVLLSFRVDTAGKIGYTPYKGSHKLHCQRCEEFMWVGPEQQQQREKGIYSLCEKCILDIHGPEALEKLIPLTNKGAGE